MQSSPLKSFIFGQSALGLAIPAFRFGEQGPKVLILGGVHGDEIEGSTCALGLLKRFSADFPYQLRLTLVPTFNMDGVINRSRLNGKGVDLNRNLPSNDWNPQAFNERYPPGSHANSEPENQALTKFLADEKPSFILSLHSWKPLLNVNGECLEEAQAIHALTGYPIEPHIGYPTPGCLGTYAGLERGMPTLTYEIERGLALDKVLEIHVPAVCAALEVAARRVE